MIWFIIIPLSLCIGILLWLLIAPVIIEIDSDADRYHLEYKTIGSGNITSDGERILVGLKLFWFRWDWDLFALLTDAMTGKKGKEMPEVEKRPDRKAGNAKKITFGKILALLKKVKIKKCVISFDTGDYLRNAWLFPVLYLFSSSNRILNINFQNKTVIKLKIVARPAGLLWTYLITK